MLRLPDLECPNCGSLYLHHGTVTNYIREEDEDVVMVVQSCGAEGVLYLLEPNHETANPSARRDGVIIEFSCEECEAISELCIAQHKGCTEIGWKS
jgi:hypothetical protein